MSDSDKPVRLDRERLIRAAMTLLEHMGAHGEAYDAHERGFRDLETTEEIVRGAQRVADFAGGMLTRDAKGLTPQVRRDNGMTDPGLDEQCAAIATKIREAHQDLDELINIHRRRYIDRHGLRGAIAQGLIRHNDFAVNPPPLGSWAQDEDAEEQPEPPVRLLERRDK